jgi:hypothetical protein
VIGAEGRQYSLTHGVESTTSRRYRHRAPWVGLRPNNKSAVADTRINTSATRADKECRELLPLVLRVNY